MRGCFSHVSVQIRSERVHHVRTKPAVNCTQSIEAVFNLKTWHNIHTATRKGVTHLSSVELSPKPMRGRAAWILGKSVALPHTITLSPSCATSRNPMTSTCKNSNVNFQSETAHSIWQSSGSFRLAWAGRTHRDISRIRTRFGFQTRLELSLPA